MKQTLRTFALNPRNLYFSGFVVVAMLSMLEALRGRHFNFMIFDTATTMFWNGVSPYGGAWKATGLDSFLYAPLFNIFFAPFAFLPDRIAPLAWNIFNFTLWFFAVFTLPEKYTRENKCVTFMFTFLILCTTQLSFQYNVTVASVFLLSFSLLERDRGFAAVVLIMLSGFTKIYGIFQLGLLLCYPRFWRNMGYTLVAGLIFALLPAVRIPVEQLPAYYEEWVNALLAHKDTRVWQTIFYIKPFFDTAPAYMNHIRVGVLLALAALLIYNRKKYGDFEFRAQSLGILTGWVILFSDSSERHTYLIALAGYMLWYWTIVPNRIDRILFWANFVVLTVMPVDLLCPPALMLFVFNTLTLNLWLFTFTWLRMCRRTLFVN
jgi:hypothetical protein